MLLCLIMMKQNISAPRVFFEAYQMAIHKLDSIFEGKADITITGIVMYREGVKDV